MKVRLAQNIASLVEIGCQTSYARNARLKTYQRQNSVWSVENKGIEGWKNSIDHF